MQVIQQGAWLMRSSVIYWYQSSHLHPLSICHFIECNLQTMETRDFVLHSTSNIWCWSYEIENLIIRDYCAYKDERMSFREELLALRWRPRLLSEIKCILCNIWDCMKRPSSRKLKSSAPGVTNVLYATCTLHGKWPCVCVCAFILHAWSIGDANIPKTWRRSISLLPPTSNPETTEFCKPVWFHLAWHAIIPASIYSSWQECVPSLW